MAYPDYNIQWTYPQNLTTFFIPDCKSTNEYLKSSRDRIEDRLPVMLRTGRQTMGRGRFSRSWFSAANLGLYLSFAFTLKSDVKINLLSLVAGVSILKFIEKISDIKPILKWPNDIIYHGKKIAGILIENQFSHKKIFSITGMGININHQDGDFPDSLKQQAASLRMFTGITFNLEQIAPLLATLFLKWLEVLKTDGLNHIIQAATEYSREFLDKKIKFSHQGKIVSGIFKGINQDGGLILDTKSSLRTIYYSGEILKE